MLGQLVGNIAGVEIREHQHIGAPSYRACLGKLLLRHAFDQRGIGLQLAVDRELRIALACNRKCAHNFLGTGVARAALGRERKQRDAWLVFEQRAITRRRNERDVGERFCVGLGVHRAIRVDKDFVL